MEFRRASSQDIEPIAKLEEQVFISPWKIAQFQYEIEENEFSNNLVIYDGNILIGYINYWVIFDQSTINKICIRDEYRKQGLAQKLMDMALEDIKEKECIVVTLEVRVSNVGAIKLYEKNDFKIVLRKEKYYSDGEDAYYMVKGVV